MRGDGINIYAMRVYDKELSADEVLQNHFAEIVTINELELDIKAFLALGAEDKLAVYMAFADSSIEDGKAVLQEILDIALADK